MSGVEGKVGIHATCVAFGGHGVLLLGPPGAGKSDLALRLIDGGATLVADDRVELTRRSDALLAAPPIALAGRLEIRGTGIVRMPYSAAVPVVLAVQLSVSAPPERLPREAWCGYLGVRIRSMPVAPFECSAVAKVRIAVYAAAGLSDPATGARPLPDEQV